MAFSPSTSYHPDYTNNQSDWKKWRYAYKGGRDFVEQYMVKLSNRETDDDFKDRKAIAYAPSFGKAAINDIKNAIFQRMAEVSRVGGPKTYLDSASGRLQGVDLQQSTMNQYIGTEVLPEMLVMRKVGVLIDQDQNLGSTQAEKGDKHPYLDVYHAEDIISWVEDVDGFQRVLLREIIDNVDEFGFPNGTSTRFRMMIKTPEGVLVKFFEEDGGEPLEEYILDIPEIPFVCFSLNGSLMEDVADYQIALLNIESSDISFIRKANYPFFYEFYDPRVEAPYKKPVAAPGEKGTASEVKSKGNEVKIGQSQGRQYPKGLDPPGFTNADPDTLRVSMEKEQQLKEDIRLLVNLNLVNMNPRRQAAESKKLDNLSLEASLSYIGLELANGESKIARYWAMFEGSDNHAKVTYPRTYNLKSEGERREEADELQQLLLKVPSPRYRRKIAMKIATITIGAEVTDKELAQIHAEIEESETLTADPDVILRSQEAGLVDDVTASNALGFKGDEVVPQAKKDRAERIALTMEAQGGEGGAARGTPEFDNGSASSSDEKKGKPTRGEQVNG